MASVVRAPKGDPTEVNSLARCLADHHRRAEPLSGPSLQVQFRENVPWPRRAKSGVTQLSNAVMVKASERRRRQSDQLEKNRAEIALGAKACFLGNVGDRHIRRGEEHLSVFNTAVLEIVHEGTAGHLFEEIHEMGFAHSAESRGAR
jgi:hypothetical protein